MLFSQSNGFQLWNNFKFSLTVDFLWKGIPKDMTKTAVFPQVTSILLRHGKTLQDYHLPADNIQEPSAKPSAPEDAQAIADQMEHHLNQEQQQNANAICACNIRVHQYFRFRLTAQNMTIFQTE